ncbi:glucans biosynthesis protein [Tistlia consotensis]|uniref:Glucans biosynthesis protein n=1 Tax=Tistlia consotensis USBA 355 TaxID=560819 RepID=A0A1Y6C379_9PROT|nr:glucan biosynthesis protein D [Tistlia consotensis]SMF39475.1 glucans biosynthesis protein [Tistlia consotensis USBA 355]SNR36366.1 glucans biosynthesis protein [Tistlia consotensis]
MSHSPERREFLGTLGLAGLLWLAGAAPGSAAQRAAGLRLGEPRPFSFEALTEQARRLAAAPYEPPYRPAPEIVQKIDYQTHGQIRFRAEDALFAEGPGVYPATFFHLGMFFPKKVTMHVVRDGAASEILYDPAYFDMPADSIARQLPQDAGFAGFRFQESRHRKDWKTQDWVAFLGASYFRAIGELGQYGLSARGIAIDTAVPGPEEFPDFKAFWIAPAPSEADPALVYALLDGPSLAGAYAFKLWRTEGVVMEIETRLFLRKAVQRLGIAPLTSMYWYSETDRDSAHDWRPEVHDSDGLAIWTGGGERLWRPLNNPPVPVTSSFVDKGPRGFGLLQRDRNFDHFLDGVHYELRPSVWVEPLDDWGDGAVQLVELNTDDEIHDNIGAFWVPAQASGPGVAYSFRYRLHWLADQPYPPKEIAQCVATRRGRGGEPGKPRPQGVEKFVVEFAGGPLEELDGDAKVTPVLDSSRGEISYVFVERIPGTRRWRVQFDLTAPGREPAELRGFLRLGKRPLTETWLYQYRPPAIARSANAG